MLFLYLMSEISAEKATEAFPEKLSCESCGESFSCGSNLGKCWCFEIEIGKETLENLKTEYNHCLCGKCLVESQQKAY